MNLEWIGYFAATCTTISFIPQILHTLRTKDTRAISLGMYSIFTTGVGAWLIYGILINNTPMTLANTITFVLASFILSFKIYQTVTKTPKL